MMALMVLIVLLHMIAVGSYVVVRSDVEANTTVTIPPGSALQDYLCSGPLQSNMTVVLEDGEHIISSESSCNIFNKGSVTITGSLDSTKRTVVRCESKTRVAFASASVQMFTVERIAFINCGIQFASMENIFIANCSFQNITNGGIMPNTNTNSDTLIGAVMLYGSTGDVNIIGCTFQNNSAGAVMLYGTSGNVCITDCTFQNNGADNDGEVMGSAVMLHDPRDNVLITECTFRDNTAYAGGAIMLYGSTGNVIITDCTFQNNSARTVGGVVALFGFTGNTIFKGCTFQDNSAYSGGAVMSYISPGNVSITHCIFLNSSAEYDGGSVMLYGTSGNVHLTDCTFHNNAAILGSAVMLVGLAGNGSVFITECTFKNNSANDGGAIRLDQSTGHVCITDCTFQDNIAGYGGGAVMFYGSTGNAFITDCKFYNNKANSGGAVKLYGSTGNVHITDCTFGNNGVDNDGGAVTVYKTAQPVDVSITGCTFQDNKAYFGGAVMLFRPTGNVHITDCTFRNNAASFGALAAIAGNGHMTITDCTFHNNSANSCVLYGSAGNATVITGCIQDNSVSFGGGSAVMLAGSTCNVRITHCTFQDNIAIKGYGALYLLNFTGNFSITDCTFKDNTAIFGGALALDESVGTVIITNCTFQNNRAIDGEGGGVMMKKSTGNVRITGCIFHMNRADFGGAIFTSMGFSEFINISITNNIATAGAAIYARNENGDLIDLITSQEGMNQLILQDVVLKDNHCPSSTCAGAIYFIGVKMDIFGSTTTGSHFSYNSPQGAIQGDGGIVTLRGYITFEHNTGVNGGAISLSNNAPLYFYPNCNVRFLKNLATGYGGAIYNNGKIKHVLSGYAEEQPKCILRLLIEKDCNSSALITFIDNHALQGGHAVYATPIYYCFNFFTMDANQFFCGVNVVNYFNITPLDEDINDVQVLSFPQNVEYCGCSDPNLCNGTYITTRPGRTVRFNITSADIRYNLSPSVVYTQVDTDGINSQNIILGPRQKAQWIGTVCGQIEYQIYGPENASLKLLLSNDPNAYPAVFNVVLLPCEPGFELMTESSTRMTKCECSPFLTLIGVTCDTSDGTVTRIKTNWIGVYNETLPALAQTCPLDYCNSTIKKLPLARPGYLCNGGRTGIICGHCHSNLSVIFGSSKCQECSDMWLTTLVMFAVLGVFLVAALFFLNLTITQGTLYGLIFYANAIQVNNSIFFNQSILNPLQVIVSLMNLDLGLPMCFYNGMDDADKAGLQFVFPAYLLILTMATILVCHYCLQRSPTTSTSFFLYKLSTIIGERAVGVLSTLIYLSYSKLMRTVIDILTYSTVHLPSGDIYVWFYDGNVEYLHGKHTALFVVAMATCTLFLLPYTFALTFIPIIEQHSEHNRLFNYLHKKTNQIKPMNDAHYAPYKGEWRWWLGARLWLLVVMYSLNPVYSSDRPSLLLTIQATMVILFTITQASIKPFGQSHQKTHQSNRRTNFYNQLYNNLDMFYLLNYIALAMSMSHTLDQSSDQTQSAMVTVGVLVGLFVVMLMVTVLYHLIVAILMTCKMYDRTREKFNGLFEKKQYDPMVPIELDDPTNSTVATTTVTVYCGLREPLSED